MTPSPKTEDVLAWLKREEPNAKIKGQIFNLQAALAATGSRMQQSYWEHIARMYNYEQTTLAPKGITVSFNPQNLYRPLGFGIKGEPGYFSWDTIRERFNLLGPRGTGTFT